MTKIRIALIAVLISLTQSVYTQIGNIYGKVKEANTGEPLLGANIILKDNQGVGTVSDINGDYHLTVNYGKHTLVVSYIGYKTQEIAVEITTTKTILDISLNNVELDEVVVVSDFAKVRETPIAFSNILPARLAEELAGRDIPMILNTTPGVYATEQGGGDGDARITIRGFNQRNVAVMLDGVPVNDMENGWVYWSNWFGLDMIQRTMQVQRGLGASKLGIPSVGGTINILTQGISNKATGTVKQEITDYGYFRTSFGVSSGKIGNWGVTTAGSYKWGNGWVDATPTRGLFYFLKLERRIGNHVVSLTGFGAPQQHGQRSYRTTITLIDSTYAVETAKITLTPTTTPKFINLGRRYNQHSGELSRWHINSNGDTIMAAKEQMNEKLNYFHKPQISLKDTWKVNDNLFISSIMYMSIGNGGGTSLMSSPRISYRTTPEINFQEIYNTNYQNIGTLSQQRESRNYLRASINNHIWYGLISSTEYQLNETVNISGGIDLRYYKGEHYRTVYDLMGGDILIDEQGNSPRYNNPDRNRYKKVNDKIGYYNDGHVKWYGVFGQVEVNRQIWSGFVSGSLSGVSYQRVDHFAKYYYKDTEIRLRRQLSIDPSIYFSDTVTVDNQKYYIGHPDVVQKDKNSKTMRFPGYTIKAGFNLNLTERINTFVNIGNLSRAPRFNNVFANNTNKVPSNLKNEMVYAVETGATYSSPIFSVNFNGYYTYWNNKPLDRIPSKIIEDQTYLMNITGIAARHAGIEIDAIYKPIKQIDIQGLVSIGDWIYNSSDSVNFVNEYGQLLNETAINYDARGVHVGDAAQTQLGASIRFTPVKGLFFQTRVTYFDRNYADFNPESLQVTAAIDNRRRESWKAPSYTLVDFTAGYDFRIYQKYRAALNLNILNIFDKIYISDALNNDSNIEIGAQNGFDAVSAGVFFGMGRRINAVFRLYF